MQVASSAITTSTPESSSVIRTIPAVDAFADLTKRPIFVASRRSLGEIKAEQAQQTAALPEAPPQPLPPLTLIGIIISPKGRTALLKSPQSKDTLILGEGEGIENWTVAEIGDDHVTFSHGSQKEDVAFPKVQTGNVASQTQIPPNSQFPLIKGP